MMKPIEAYKLYHAIKLHFQTDYDYFKYNGKTNASFSSFARQKGHFFFGQLAKHKDPVHLLVSNFISDSPPKWIGDCTNDHALEVYANYKKRHNSLLYLVKSELNAFDDKHTFKKGFVVPKDDSFPLFLLEYKRGHISPETFALTNKVLPFISIWSKSINDTIIWPEIEKTILKYTPFINCNHQKVKEIVKSFIANPDK